MESGRVVESPETLHSSLIRHGCGSAARNSPVEPRERTHRHRRYTFRVHVLPAPLPAAAALSRPPHPPARRHPMDADPSARARRTTRRDRFGSGSLGDGWRLRRAGRRLAWAPARRLDEPGRLPAAPKACLRRDPPASNESGALPRRITCAGPQAKRRCQAGQASGLTRRGGFRPRNRPRICSADHTAIARRASTVTPAVWKLATTLGSASSG